MFQNANLNLDQDLRLSRSAKYEKSQQESVDWITHVLQLPQTEIDQIKSSKTDLMALLKDGMLLCSLGNLLDVPLAPTRRVKNSRMPFVQMENILFFLQLCKTIGVAHDEIFQTVDLFEAKDPYQVVVTLMAFSRRAHEMNPLKFPSVIGPKVIKVRPQVPIKPRALQR